MNKTEITSCDLKDIEDLVVGSHTAEELRINKELVQAIIENYSINEQLKNECKIIIGMIDDTLNLKE